MPLILRIPAQAGTQKNMSDAFVYILASRKNGTLYIGSALELKPRIWLHKQGLVEGFTKTYRVTSLVYFEIAPNRHAALVRERQMKEWKRAWKIRLIETMNPGWEDLYDAL